MRINLIILFATVGVEALSSKRLRRKDSVIEINGQSKPSSGILFHENEDEFADVIRLLQESDVAMSASSMSMMTDDPSSAPTSVPATTLPPVTPVPITPAPVTPAPTTLAPVTPAPVTPAPVTPAPTTPAPVTPAPVTPAPVTPSPVTPAPTTAAPDTPSPTSSAAVTGSPTTAPIPLSTFMPTTVSVPVTPTMAPTTSQPTQVPVALTPAPVATPVATIIPTTILVPITPAPVESGSTAGPTTIMEPYVPTPSPVASGSTPSPSIIPSIIPSLVEPSSTLGPTAIMEPVTPSPVEPGSTAGPTTIMVPNSSEPSAAPAFPTSETTAPTPLTEEREKVIFDKCGVTSLERSRDILSILSVISDPVDLITPTSSQFRARDWLDNRDAAVICATETDHISQRYRVALLYFGLGGPSWLNCRAWEDSDMTDMCLEEDVRTARRLKQMMEESNGKASIANYRPRTKRDLQNNSEKFDEEESTRWLSDTNECEWFGLDCGDAFLDGGSADAYFPLVNIDLGSNNLNGPLLPEFFGFLELQALFMDGNINISGSIPEELGQMNQLKFLDIDDSAVSGSLPEALFTLRDLIVIDLNSNQLTGTLSAGIGEITGLEILQLENNSMTGDLPTEALLDLERLVALTLEGNFFTGTLEPLCEVRDERREDYEIYLNFMFAECGGSEPLVECSCCVCY